jgi:hypothetical protein
MSTLTLASPGVQINEVDLSLLARTTGATNIFVTGFTDKGPTDEVVNVGSITEYEDIFGAPTNGAERYLYQSAKQVLTQSNGNLLVSRMPYGSGAGAGFSNTYSALVYPITSNNNSSFSDSTIYTILAPKSVLLTEDQYNSVLAGDVTWSSSNQFITSSINVISLSTTPFNSISSAYFSDLSGVSPFNGVRPQDLIQYPWSDGQYSVTFYLRNYNSGSLLYEAYIPKEVTNFSTIGNAGLVVLNPSKLSVNNLFEGYYIGIADNSNNNPASDFTCITGIKAAQGINGTTQTFVNVPSSRLGFKLTTPFTSTETSISEIVEKFPVSYDFSSSSFKDCLTLMVFKIRSSIYSQDTVSLDYVTQEGYTGSLYGARTQNNANGGAPVTFALEDVANQRSNNIKVLINPNISQASGWIGSDGVPQKSVRVSDDAKNLYSEGVYISSTNSVSKDVGNVPQKLQRILNNVDTLDIPLDVTAEVGLGTIWASANARHADVDYGNNLSSNPYLYDEYYNLDISGLKSQTDGYTSQVALDYNSVASQFVSFAENTRKDHVFIADPLKAIFVSGNDIKTSKIAGYIFSSDVYWPIKNLYASSISSYTAVYGNWVKVNDVTSDKQVWVPASGYAAAVFAQSAATSFPWSAPAGFNRGALTNVLDLAINPTQKHRDLLYRININPIAYFPGDGYVIYGQKTLFTKPSAFDRINVRRLFLTLEKSTQSVLKYFVFEPNTFTTRTRLVNTLTPIFNQAKNNNGLYDFKIVCDERNNTPDIIDQNQLKVSIYIQPVRTAEFILADFIATQTGVNFNELIG